MNRRSMGQSLILSNSCKREEKAVQKKTKPNEKLELKNEDKTKDERKCGKLQNKETRNREGKETSGSWNAYQLLSMRMENE